MKRTFHLMAAIFIFCICLTRTWGASCYPDSMRQYVPPILQTVVVLVDETTPKEATAEKILRENIGTIVDTGAKNIAFLAFAGNAPGQSLRVLGRWTLEDRLTDEAAVNDTVISVYKRSQVCVKKNRDSVKVELAKALDGVFSAMPIAGERSEIQFAVASTIKDFARSGQSLLVLNYSDGIQYAKGTNARTFYRGNGQGIPRKLDPKIELGYAAKEPLTAPRKIDGATVSVVWHGMLALPIPKTKEKPIYIDTPVIGSFVEFWTEFLRSQGVQRVQIGTPVLNNVDLSIPSSLNPK